MVLTASLITISIHAPARGATFITVIGLRFRLISIHAPARGATCRQGTYFWQTSYFNPRSREGSDGLIRITFNVAEIFQSTLPRGERPAGKIILIPSFVFQSTLPRGERRYRGLLFVYYCQISIHAPARGATAIFTKILFNLQ